MPRARTADLPSDTQIKNILVIKWSALGDVMIASALFDSIRQAFPQARIDLDTRQAYRSLFATDTRFNQIIVPGSFDKVSGFRRVFKWVRWVRRQHYDLIIDLQSNDRSRMLLSLLKLSAGVTKWILGTHPVYPYTVASQVQSDTVHAYAHLSAALQAGGIKILKSRPSFPISDEFTQSALHLLQQAHLSAGGFAVFLPGSHAAALTKRWGVDNYIGLAKNLHEKMGLRSVLIGSVDEAEDCAKIQDGASQAVVNLCGQTKIEEIVPICADANFIVANDTGTAHIASSTDTPILLICGPTNPERVKPVGDQVVTLQADIECRNCYQKTCGHHSCMRMLDVDQVYARIEAMQGADNAN